MVAAGGVCRPSAHGDADVVEGTVVLLADADELRVVVVLLVVGGEGAPPPQAEAVTPAANIRGSTIRS